MKRVGMKLRECDSKYLSGRPSFTLSSWGESLTLMKSGHNMSSAGSTMSNNNLPINHKTRGGSTSNTIVVAHGAEAAFGEAKAVYVSASLPMLSHIWPSIERSPDATTPVSHASRSLRMGASKSTAETIARKVSLDPYAADGSQFRSETMGNQLSNYTEGVHNDNLTHKMKRDVKKHRTEKITARKALESKRKQGWNAAPHVVLNTDPKLNDPSPFKAVTYEQYYKQKRKKETKKMKGAYSSMPFVIAKPVVKVPAIRGRRSPQKSKTGLRSPMETMGEEDEDAFEKADEDQPHLKSTAEFPHLNL